MILELRHRSWASESLKDSCPTEQEPESKYRSRAPARNCEHILAIVNDTAINIGHGLFEILISMLLGIYPELRLLDQMAVLFLIWRGWKFLLFSQKPYDFTFAPIAYKGSGDRKSVV